jgi:hypothetical protein
MKKRLRKEGKKHARLTYQVKSLPLQHEFGRVTLPLVRSNGPTDPLHISCICSIWKILHFYSSFSLNPSKSAFFQSVDTLFCPRTTCLLFLNCACSRRVHIEGHMNRFEFLLSWTIILIMIVLSLFFSSKNCIFCSITWC